MTKRMLVDATHPEETRVAIVDGNWLSDFDFERTNKKQLKGNIYLAKVIRVEPSLQAAFVEYGGNRHGFLPFSEIHPDYFRIPVADRPHDEEQSDAEDEDNGDDHSETSEQDMQAYADDMALEQSSEHAHGDDPHDGQGEDLSSLSNPHSVAELQPIPSEFTTPATDDLGLITDFGNAILNPATPIDGLMTETTAPLETVGGEMAEDERYRRPPRVRYKIQEVVKRRQVMLIQVVKEERGNKGAALTTFLSLAGRYCVLMPNTDHGGGVSRKITSHQDRRRMKEMLDQLEIPEGMAVILRTAGMEQEPAEIQRDLEYLLRLWNNIREQTLQSTAPALIYEEANLIKRSMRDMYAPDLSEILVAGTRGYQVATDFMRTIMPDQLDKVKLYEDTVPLFFRYNVEKQIDQLYSPTVQLRSGGYIVINPTEALVSIDVNSGRATRERHIEGTALKTNLEAADEIARQLRLRDLAGLVVIDFIDMEDGRNNAAVERRMKDAMRGDRARLQIGRISPFGLLELSRQRLHSSLMEINFEKCTHCAGLGLVRSVDSAAISILRMVEEEGIRGGAQELILHVPTKVALYILNQKRPILSEIEARYNITVLLHSDDALVPPDFRLERGRGGTVVTGSTAAVNTEQVFADTHRDFPPPPDRADGSQDNNDQQNGFGGRQRGRHGFGRGRNRNNNNRHPQPQHRQEQPHSPEPQGQDLPSDTPLADNVGNVEGAHQQTHTSTHPNESGRPDDQQRRGGRRRGRRGGRGRHGGNPQGDRPRDPNYQPRQDQRRENWQNRQNNPAHVPTAIPTVPTSIHDIDTTPREPSPIRTHYASHNANPATNTPPRSPASSAPPPYEIVDQASDKPKGGWWRKLTGQ